MTSDKEQEAIKPSWFSCRNEIVPTKLLKVVS